MLGSDLSTETTKKEPGGPKSTGSSVGARLAEALELVAGGVAGSAFTLAVVVGEVEELRSRVQPNTLVTLARHSERRSDRRMGCVRASGPNDF